MSTDYDYDYNYNLDYDPHRPQQLPFEISFNIPQIANNTHNLVFNPYSEQYPPFTLPQMNIINRNINLDYDPHRPQQLPFEISFNIPQIANNEQHNPTNQNQNHNQHPIIQQPQNLNNVREQQNIQQPQNSNDQTNNNKDKQSQENNNKKDSKKNEEEIEEEEKEKEKKNKLLWLLYLLLFLLALAAIILLIVYMSKLLDKDKTENVANNASSNTTNTQDTNINENLLLSQKDGTQTTLGEIIGEGNTNFNGSNNAKDILNGDINLSEEVKRCILAENQTSSKVKIFEDLDGNGIYTEGIDNLLAEGSGFSVDGGLATLYDEACNKINIKLGDNICANSNTLGNFSTKDLNLMDRLSIKKDPLSGKCYSVLEGDINVDLNISKNNIYGDLSSCGVNIGNFNTTNLDKNKFANACIDIFYNDKNKISSLSDKQKKLLDAWQKERNITGVNSSLNYFQNNNNPSKENLNSQNNNLQL